MTTNHNIEQFKTTIWNYYREHGRTFAWRHEPDPYKIVVSEIMLQQTQTHRIALRYPQFIHRFPTFESLAQAPLQEVLLHWQGLGYNRRGKYLHDIAKKVVTEYNGILPNNPSILKTFPGLGPATAASICAFAFNAPTVFIETNIRAVYIHFFFNQRNDVHDKELIPLIEQTIDQERPREWYYALMDYGVMLKKTIGNPSRKSAHHTKQSRFEGSDRQIRGMILKLLTRVPQLRIDELYDFIQKEPDRIDKALDQLSQEKMVKKHDDFYLINE